MNKEQLAAKINEQAAVEFDKIKDARNLTYERDFNGFAVGYLIGALAASKTIEQDKKKNNK